MNIINNPEFTENKELHEKVVNGYVSLAEKLVNKENKKVKLFSTETRDYEVINDVYSKIDNKEKVEIVKINNFEELLELYSSISVLIGARMHSMIIAYTQMVPIVGLSWQPKVQAMFDIIDESNHCFNLIDLKDYLNEIVDISINKINIEDTTNMHNQLKLIKKKEEINEQIFKKLRSS